MSGVFFVSVQKYSTYGEFLDYLTDLRRQYLQATKATKGKCESAEHLQSEGNVARHPVKSPDYVMQHVRS